MEQSAPSPQTAMRLVSFLGILPRKCHTLLGTYVNTCLQEIPTSSLKLGIPYWSWEETGVTHTKAGTRKSGFVSQLSHCGILGKHLTAHAHLLLCRMGLIGVTNSETCQELSLSTRKKDT